MKILKKLFGKKPLYQEKEVEFLGQKGKMMVYDKNRILEAIEAAPNGSIMFVSDETYILITHVPSPESFALQCDLDCENCDKFTGYGEEENGY